MAAHIVKECKFCSKKILGKHGGSKYCSPECRFMEIASSYNGIDGCWEWKMSRNPQTGYGQFMTSLNNKRKLETAHRLSFSIFNGGIQDGMDICHKCDNRGCFNPAHLFSGTAKDNMRDMMEKNRMPNRSLLALRGKDHWSAKKPERIPVGTRHFAAKLTEEIVILIRQSKETSTALARLYGVSISTLSAARHGKTWRHV